MVALEGQHKEFVANAFSKVVPSSTNALRLGMCFSVAGLTSSKARSSARISTTFGGLGFSFLSSLSVSSAWGKQPARAKQHASNNGKGVELGTVAVYLPRAVRTGYGCKLRPM